MNEISSFLLGFLFNFLIALLVVRFIYYPTTHDKRYVFTFLAFNTVIYFVLSFMTSIEIGVGVGFGLFAIFSILRYRTDPIPIREMTYLFIIVAPKALPYVFDRFYQADKARNANAGKMGLGLAICKALITAQGGAISAQSAGRGQGTSMLICFTPA